jgi:DNA polymerase III gamma/tau subunit
VSVEEVVTITGAPKSDIIERIIKGLSEGSGESAIKALHDAVGSNADISVLLMLLIDRVRMLLMLRYAPTVGESMIADLTDTDQGFLRELAKDAKSKINSEALRKLLIANIETSRSPVPELPLELAIMELVQT